MSFLKVALILSGGRSTRMGEDKAYLKFRGHTLLEHMQFLVRPLVQQVYISSNKEGIPDDPTCPSPTCPARGPISGIKAFYTMIPHPKPLVLIVPVDMPQLKEKDLQLLLETLENKSEQGVYFNDFPMPCCLYASKNKILTAIDRMKGYSLKNFLSQIKAFKIDHDQFDGSSINTKEAWEEYKRLCSLKLRK